MAHPFETRQIKSLCHRCGFFYTEGSQHTCVPLRGKPGNLETRTMEQRIDDIERNLQSLTEALKQKGFV